MQDPTFLIILALGLVAMWFMSSRSRKRQQQVVDFRNNLEPGTEIMTTSGLFATVIEVDGEVVWLEAADGVVTKWYKPAISKLASDVLPVFDEDEEGEYDEDADDEYGEEGAEGAEGAEELAFEVPDDASSLTDDDSDGSR